MFKYINCTIVDTPQLRIGAIAFQGTHRMEAGRIRVRSDDGYSHEAEPYKNNLPILANF